MIVLDTNVLSEEMKPAPEPVVHGWLARQNPLDLFTTAVTEAEILYGVAIKPDGRRKRDIGAAAQRILGLFAGRVLPFDSAAAREFAQIVADRLRAGRPIKDFDAQIAAITRSRGMTLATRDLQDFADTGVQVVDPWSP
jgi:toxin FitB